MTTASLPDPDDRTVQALTAVGIVLVVVGTVLDVGEVAGAIRALGVGLSVAGVVFLAAPGDPGRRNALAGIALVASQLALVGGTLGTAGIGGLLAVGGAVAWLSLQDD